LSKSPAVACADEPIDDEPAEEPPVDDVDESLAIATPALAKSATPISCANFMQCLLFTPGHEADEHPAHPPFGKQETNHVPSRGKTVRPFDIPDLEPS
jgi:hypothetical protein